jgi:FtsP/CotA-like multicopper oxidase with cupredoxin domain
LYRREYAVLSRDAGEELRSIVTARARRETAIVVSRSIWHGRSLAIFFCATACLLVAPKHALAHVAPEPCPNRPAVGSVVREPDDLRSQKGVLRVDLTYLKFVNADGQTHYCYLYKDGSEAPTLHLKAGDLLILHLKNGLTLPSRPQESKVDMPAMRGECTGRTMTSASTNIHFHGLSVPPVCHEDDVLHTLIQPGDPPFEYRFRIPRDEPPGLYWYHPHVHGMTSPQVQGGASGALIVEGIERADTELAGLGQRVFIIRDQELLNPNEEPVKTDSMPPPIVLRDAEGDILNTGTGGGKPAKDLSINFVPVPYPRYSPAVVRIRPGERQLWCVLNASAITYLDLQMLVENKPQMMGVVSLDGVPINRNGRTKNRILWQSHILLPPAGRAEIIVKAPAEGARASLVTRTVDTGPAGENDPTRPLAAIVGQRNAPEPRVRLAASPTPLPPPRSVWLGDVKPVRTRTLYFSERPHDPKNPKSPTDFYITVEGQEPKVFDPRSTVPNIVVQQGDVEDWIIENRTQELHAFHIHQIHFMLVEWNGVPLDEPFLRDTINVAYWDGKSRRYPSVKLRMDFRDPNVVGTFVYHCHLLEHEDGGMMGVIRIVPRGRVAHLSEIPADLGRPLCGLPSAEVGRSGVHSHRANPKANSTEVAARTATFNQAVIR